MEKEVLEGSVACGTGTAIVVNRVGSFPIKTGTAKTIYIYTILSNVFQGLLTSAGTFWLFSGMCALNIIFTAIFVPETKGKTLEQIQTYFKGTPVLEDT